MTQQETPGQRTEAAPASAPIGLPDEAYYRRNAGSERSNRPALGVILIIIGLIWLFTAWRLPGAAVFGGPAGAGTVVDRTVQARRLALDAGTADVQLSHWNGEGIRVQAIRRGGTDDDYTISIRQDDDTLRINHTESPCVFFCTRELTYRIELPADIPATVITSSGDVEAEGLSGGVDVKTTSGDIELSGISGPVSADSTSGDVRLEDGRASGTNVSTTSGAIDLAGLSEAIVVSSVSGDIAISDARDGLLTISTTSGDIEYEGSLSSASASTIDTISGDVRLRVPASGGLRIDASSISGAVESDLELSGRAGDEHSLRGTAGDGAASLKISTTSGDVSIERQ